MKEITLRSYLHITSRKKNDRGKLITNTLIKDLKIKEDDFLIVSVILGGNMKDVKIENDNNGLTKITRATDFYRMLNDSCDFEEYYMI